MQQRDRGVTYEREAHTDERVTLAVRPENVRLGSEGGIRGRVEEVVYRGSDTDILVRIDDALMIRFSVTLGEEPELELAWVKVPLCTENALRFSARLDDGSPEVRFECSALTRN